MSMYVYLKSLGKIILQRDSTWNITPHNIKLGRQFAKNDMYLIRLSTHEISNIQNINQMNKNKQD
jgi:hypothetical protein